MASCWKFCLPPPCTEQTLHGADIPRHANLVCMQSCMLIPECVLQGTSCMRSTCGSPRSRRPWRRSRVRRLRPIALPLHSPGLTPHDYGFIAECQRMWLVQVDGIDVPWSRQCQLASELKCQTIHQPNAATVTGFPAREWRAH